MWAVMPADRVKGWVQGDLHYAAMSSESVSKASAMSTLTFAGGWGMEDYKVSMMGMRLRVLKGRWVWPLALHQMVMARAWRAFVEQHLEVSDFVAVPVGPWTMWGLFLEEVLWGWAVDWANCRIPSGEADCVLAALGLLHMRVKCVISAEMGEDYLPQVSACGLGACVVGVVLTAVSLMWSCLPIIRPPIVLRGIRPRHSVHSLWVRYMG